MKIKDLLNLVKTTLPLIVFTCISNLFFIFLAWVAYPETFKLLVGVMIIFSISSIAFSLFFIWKKENKKDKAFYAFLKDPTEIRESRLIEIMGEMQREKISYLANIIRKLDGKLDDTKLQIVQYEEFIESWVHEIKTPISLATLVLENRKEEMSPLVYKRLEHARISINDSVERILFYARLQAAHVDYRLERILLNLCCEDVLLELAALLDENEVKLILDTQNIPIVSDKKAFEFILKQILINSVKYSNKKSNKFIQLKTGLDSITNQYFLEILDNGIGVLSSDLPFIFDKGFTGDNPNFTKSTGMGLYLVKKICDELQIKIKIWSQQDNGLKITLYFPVVEDIIK